MNNFFDYTIIDLTHTLDETTPSWHGECGFEQPTTLDYSDCSTDIKFKVQRLKIHAGIGTHLDAPAHCIPSGKTVDQLNLTDLIAPCIVVDVSSSTHEKYTVSLDDILIFEKKHGTIQSGTMVMIYTGWDQFWSQPEKYRNNHIFPAISNEAAQLLLERGMVGLGIDTLSPDRPDSGYPVHSTLLGAGKYIIENATNLRSLPPTGSFVFALPIKTKGGTEAPIRLIALIKK